MARRSAIVAVTAVVLAAWPGGGLAATAPTSAPQLASAPFASPVTFRWTPAPDVLNSSQTVMRSPGTCTAPSSGAQPIGVFSNSADNATVGALPDGAYCFSIVATDVAGGSAQGPGLTVVVDSTSPAAGLLVAGQSGGAIAGVVSLTPAATDGMSGVASTVVRVGPAGGCTTGTALGAVWDTTGYANGAYDVCNVVTDNAGHTAIATVHVTIANARAPAAAVPTRGAPAAASGPTARDRVAPRRPAWRSLVAPRAKRGTRLIPFTIRWIRPSAPDLDRFVVVVNLKHAPKSPSDGRVLNRGLKTSVALQMRSRLKAHIALYAYDHSGNVSRAARRDIALASLVPLRPLTGSFLHKVPQLRWRASAGVEYYNLQLFRNGRRVLVRWPTHPSYRLPAGRLRPGTYTWFVWPAVRHKGSAPTFGSLIGRSTFVLKAP